MEIDALLQILALEAVAAAGNGLTVIVTLLELEHPVAEMVSVNA